MSLVSHFLPTQQPSTLEDWKMEMSELHSVTLYSLLPWAANLLLYPCIVAHTMTTKFWPVFKACARIRVHYVD